MIDRIKRIMEMENLTPSQFADEIDVQRSSLSHVLSGRNKPSLDFVMKVKLCFSDINLEWLIFGNGEMLESSKGVLSDTIQKEKTLFDADSPLKTIPESYGDLPDTDKKSIKNSDDITTENKIGIESSSEGNNMVEKVILLLQDGTFREYTK